MFEAKCSALGEPATYGASGTQDGRMRLVLAALQDERQLNAPPHPGHEDVIAVIPFWPAWGLGGSMILGLAAADVKIHGHIHSS